MLSEIKKSRREWMIRNNSYAFTPYEFFNYSRLSKICYVQRTGRCKRVETYNDCIIMADTETSKETPGTICRNYVVAWTISIRAFDMNIVTLYGHKPSEMVDCINRMRAAMPGEKTIIYFHHLNYDWTFLRKFYIREWGTPEHQLNTKRYYPIYIQFSNGIVLRDSLILAQRGLDKWAKDMEAEHQKAVGAWDYDKRRNQNENFTPLEKTYIEHDTLAGVECLQKTIDNLGKRIFSVPYTATGIVRNIVQMLAKKNNGKRDFLRIVPPYYVQVMLEKAFHGGYVHNNRFYTEKIIKALIDEWDGISWYPALMILERFPMEKFTPLDKIVSPEFVLKYAEDYAYLFKLILIRPKMKPNVIMPTLARAKCEKIINPVEDNGRLMEADYIEIYANETDLSLYAEQYTWQKAACIEVHFARKGYLPRWYTDFVFKCFEEKQRLKGKDPVLYSIAKGKLNSLFGMAVQRPVKIGIEENYENGEFELVEGKNEEELYNVYVNKRSSVLPYQWGVWVTSYGQKFLHLVGSFAGTWYYSDTDSVFGSDWNQELIEAFNKTQQKRLLERGYGPVVCGGKEWWLGNIQLEGQFKEFISVGAKRYATKDLNGLTKITAAGVPKAGVTCLQDDLRNFRAGFVFKGEMTGKKRNTYFIEDDIWIDENGNERGDSIDLSPDDYTLDSYRFIDEEKLFMEEVQIQVYE